ncbi:MAG: NIPSNAP family protein [Rubripirellula sp.]
MHRLLLPFLLLSCILPSEVRVSAEQYYEVRSYLLGASGDAAAIDQYLGEALIPALNRQNVGPVGVFSNAPSDEPENGRRIIVVIPHSGADGVKAIQSSLQSDPAYQQAAKPYLERGPKEAPHQRIESELLAAMKCMPALKVAPESLANAERVYELRIYESANERLGNLKVDMFDSGEVPIFLDSGIQPVFIGQAVVGPYTPNLSYLTVYPNDAARLEAWKAFRVHPDWQVLKEVAKYKGTVSKIHKYVLSPKPYSQM